MAESFAALNTVIGLFSGVFPHMKSKRRDLREGFPTLAAVEGFLACVTPYVDGKG